MCNYPNCKTISNYNFQGEKYGLYCKMHKIDNMIDVKNKKCFHIGCKKLASFNYEHLKTRLYCSKHKLEGMISMSSLKCNQLGCNLKPSFNFSGETKPLYCYTHKLQNMLNIVEKKCIHNNCNLQPSYNFFGEKTKLFCQEHKLNGMVYIRAKHCLHENCCITPSYNFKGEKKAIYCSIHKLENMVNVKHGICIFNGCTKIHSFNYAGSQKGIYCFEHKLDGKINVRDKLCKTHLCYTRVANKYDGYCLRCYVNVYPNKPVSRNYKTKEYAVVEYVKNKFPGFTWIEDKTIQDGCSKKRPDLLLDLGYQILIIEIDENQHDSYDNICENKRMMEISQDLGHRPIIFIRFNPDDYLDKNTNITSCWTYNKYGISIIKKFKTKEWNDRLYKLENEIKYWSSPENVTLKTINIINLFYDT